MILILNIFKFIVLIIATFFTCQIITQNNKRISYIGVLLLCFSSAIVEYINSGLVESLIFGEFIFISLNNILENSKYKYLYVSIIPISIICFLLLSNISFQIVVGIVFLSLILWKILDWKLINKERIENIKKINKDSIEIVTKNEVVIIDKKISIILSVSILISLIFGMIFYKYQPLKRLENQNGINYLFSYTYKMFYLFNNNIKYENAMCLSTFISVFPVGLILGVYYIFKEQSKHLYFIMINTIISILELMLIVSNIVISFLPNYIIVLGFNLLQIFMIIYMFSRVEYKMFSLTKSAYLALLGLVIFIFIPYPKGLIGVLFDLSYMIFVLEEYLVLNYSDKRFWRLSSWVYTIICLFDFFSAIIIKFLL